MERTRVYLEVGTKKVFACAVDHPGWCRSAKTEQAALEELLTYADRYAAVVGPGFAVGEVEVVGRLKGSATTDFGAPDARGDWDLVAVEPEEASRLAHVMEASWAALDAAVASASAELRKGPRGGGRDRDQVAEHVRESERSYGRTVGVRVPPRTPWAEQREAIVAAVRAGGPGGQWPLRYAVRRLSWHVLDHAWEIEDKNLG